MILIKILKKPWLACACLITLASVPMHAIKDAKMEFQGWGGVNFATKSTFAKDYTDATFIQPRGGFTAWFSQPFLLPDVLDIGISGAYQPIMTYTAGTGNVTSVVAIPATLELRYRFPYGIYAALGAGYAYSRLKVNNESTGTNAAVINAKGGYQYDIWQNLSAIGQLELQYFLQNLTFAGAGEKSNSQLNIGISLGVAYKL
ncbi:MAG TPA: hypothetical protein PKY99_11965 [Turneriella sp.]|nr:hypothetical protein [Turneriella sp.]